MPLSPMNPRLNLRLLPPFDPENWGDVARAFEGADGVALGQHWLGQCEPNFRGGFVRAGFTEDALWVYAHLDDDDIFNAATDFNQLLCASGDCFEIFLRPAGGEVYYEFHISPENQVLQLRWPDAQAFHNSGGDLAPFLIQPRRLRSATHVNRDAGNWRVLAGLTWELLNARPHPKDVAWNFSFGRYDSTRGQKTPVLSSSSSHQEPCFHRQHEWGELQFERALTD